MFKHWKKCALLAGFVAGMSSPAAADGGLSFIINGDTFSQPYRIDNTSTGGERVLRFGMNLVGTGYAFDTVVGGGPNTGNPNNGATAFSPFGGTDVATGLVGPVTVADNTGSFSIDFNTFNVGLSFQWLIDVDPVTNDPNRSVTVLGSDLIGATGFVDFSNGLRSIGIFAAVAGLPEASAFTVTSIVVTPGVPEPSTWAMMLIGFAGLAMASRRRDRGVLAAA